MHPEGFQRASGKPFGRSRRSEIPCLRKEQLWLKVIQFGRAHLARHCTVVGMSSLGARLRTREVRGRDASLPALCLTVPLEWSPVEQLGRCPKPHKGRCPLTLQGEIFPLTPFARLSWARFHTSSACCFFLFFTPPPVVQRHPPSAASSQPALADPPASYTAS